MIWWRRVQEVPLEAFVRELVGDRLHRGPGFAGQVVERCHKLMTPVEDGGDHPYAAIAPADADAAVRQLLDTVAKFKARTVAPAAAEADRGSDAATLNELRQNLARLAHEDRDHWYVQSYQLASSREPLLRQTLGLGADRRLLRSVFGDGYLHGEAARGVLQTLLELAISEISEPGGRAKWGRQRQIAARDFLFELLIVVFPRGRATDALDRRVWRYFRRLVHSLVADFDLAYRLGEGRAGWKQTKTTRVADPSRLRYRPTDSFDGLLAVLRRWLVRTARTRGGRAPLCS